MANDELRHEFQEVVIVQSCNSCESKADVGGSQSGFFGIRYLALGFIFLLFLLFLLLICVPIVLGEPASCCVPVECCEFDFEFAPAL